MLTKLSKYAEAQYIASANDLNTPYTFKEWCERNTGILHGKEITQYKRYVKQWYTDKEQETTTSDTIKEDYINLLKQLTLVFKSEADAAWLSNIDFENSDELKNAIPFYATKLKEIAVYFINKREAIRRAKIKYNTTGTFTALEKIFYEYLLKAFTKRQFPSSEYITNVTDLSVLDTLPELSAVKDNFNITIEELYDDSSYFDRNPALPVSSYFTFDSNVTSYLDSLNLTSSDYTWLYSTGVTPICADNPLLWSIDNVLNQYKNGIPLSALELTYSDVLNEYNKFKLSKKYLGCNQYILSGGYWTEWSKDIKYDIEKGNNWFYWLTGKNVFENDTSIAIDPIELSSTSLIDNNATAGINPSSSDIIYVSRNNLLSGAWLKLNDKNTFNMMMTARLNRGKTAFAFPFPGLGICGEGLEWTGKGLNNLDQTFYYLNKEDQATVYSMYWNSFNSSISSFASIYINDTNLIENGAYAADNFSKADFIISRSTFKDNIQDYIYTDEQKYAWLYKILNSDLPIHIGDNNIYWPLERYDTSIKMNISGNLCEPVSLSSISNSIFVGSVASNKVNSADKIFKKISPNSTEYKEGAWLSGALLSQPIGITNASLVTGCYQPGLATKIYGGYFSSFLWTDNTISADNVFNNKQHQDSCDYLKETQFSLLNELPTQQKDLNYNQWNNCSCRAIVYSPLGHPGNAFDDYKGVADYIVAITSPMSSFSFKDWRGIDKKSYLDSDEFGWFKLNNLYRIEPDIGWGSGNWITNTGTPFMLSANVMYMYFRHNMLRDNADVNVPYLITRYKNNNSRTCWRKLVLDKSTSQWVDAGVETDMIFYPGDMLSFIHNETYSITLTSLHYEYSTREIPTIPDFNNFSLVSNMGETNLPISNISIPVQAIGDDSTSSNLILSTVNYINSDYYGMPSGNISISASFANPISTTVSTTLSTITTTLIDYHTYISEATNFILNVPLYGWNYNTSVYDVSSHGARPIWVEASDKDDAYTKGKSIDVWSGSPVLVDEYNFITQPVFSNMILSDGTYIEYNKRNTGSILWKQPVTVTTEISTKRWCSLIIDNEKTINLSSVFYNNINDIIASATDILSDIVLDIQTDQPLLVNYYARNPITWIQKITNSSLGVPPTGGVWHSISAENLIISDAPYAHLSNRHFPTYASTPSVGELYTTKDVGGYFIPRMLGISTAVSKNNKHDFDTSAIDNDPSKRNTTVIYRDLNTYLSDRGFSKSTQVEPIYPVVTDSSWMKADATEGQRAGSIVNARQHQEFTPYQTKFENTGMNDSGIFRQGDDSYDPWSGTYDITWNNDVDWPSNWRGQYDIAGWYRQQSLSGQSLSGMQIYQWKTDIFGNQYALFKNNFTDKSIYEKKHNIGGSLWTRNSRNIIQPSETSLLSAYNYMPSSVKETFYDNSSSICDIDIWYDTLMLYTSAALLFFHLNFDYDTGIISSNADEINYILTTNSKFGGTWFHENDKKVTICTMLSCDDQIRPVLRSLDLETNQLKYIYNKESSFTCISSISSTSYDHPVFTYDDTAKIYNISYISYNDIKTGAYLTTINIKDFEEYHDIISVKTIIPEI
jgi:hypothetical protein